MSEYADGGLIKPQEKDCGLSQVTKSEWSKIRPIKPNPARLSPRSKRIIEALEKEETTMIVEPSVKLIAHTKIDTEAIGELMDIQPESTDAETLVTFAGRSCYESWHRPTEKTRRDCDYIERTIFEQNHGSILEHATATLHITGMSRACLLELERHRLLSFSVRSQRFVDESGANIILPPIYRSDQAKPGTALHRAAELLEGIAQDLDSHYEGLVAEAELDGHKRKQAREAARAILPNMTETKVIVTANLRAWLEVIERRTAPDADAEIQEVMNLAREALRPVAPTLFK